MSLRTAIGFISGFIIVWAIVLGLNITSIDKYGVAFFVVFMLGAIVFGLMMYNRDRRQLGL